MIGALAGFTTANAVAGAVYGLGGAAGVPRGWLRGSPFSDYTVPSVVLGAAVGGTAAIASVTSWRGHDRAPAAPSSRVAC